MIKNLKIFLLVFLLFSFALQAQNKYDALKMQAQVLMKEGRFGEAVDQLNKYVAANPRVADGYHLRGLCFEERTEYANAVLDLRRARSLDPYNSQIKIDLDRVIAVWHKLLYQKIDGHKRDIAIDPDKAFSYLEIGKSYRWLEEWKNAEIWYDEYLKRDDNASPDEIIRYSEILAKTGSVIKGERILKKFVDRYPDDWRLWSRYGYFTLWLGKNKVAEDAFTKSLSFKPFFKEAEDGLDLSRRQGYLTLYQGRAFEKNWSQDYPIDRYNRMLVKEPDNDKIRFDLTDELIKNNRYEEALQQLQYLASKHAEEDRYKNLWKTVTTFRDSTFNKSVDEYTAQLKNNPSDKVAAMKLAEAYSNLYNYDSAIEVLGEFLQNIPEDQDLDARFKYAQYNAWNYNWEKSIAEITKLLGYDPNNLDYQLLRAQIAVWTVNDLDLAEKYLLNNYQNRPNDLNVVLSLSSMYSWKKQFDESKKYLDIAKMIAPNSQEVQSAESTYSLHLSSYEEGKIFEIKSESGKLAQEGKCEEALSKYDVYKSKRTALTRDEWIEYADINSCAKNYSKAIEIYSQLLADQFDYNIALQRATNYFYNHDSTNALLELENLSKQKQEDYQTKLILANSYIIVKQFEKAETILNEVESITFDPEQLKQINQKKIYLAEALAADNKLEAANDRFKVLNEDITDSDLRNDLKKRWLYLGYLFVQDKKFDEAKSIFNTVNLQASDGELKKDLNQKQMFLGDAYVADERFGDAKDIYNELLESSQDTSEIRAIKERIRWLPPSGFGRGISSVGNFFAYFFPTNIGLSPFGSYYQDNQKFQFWNYGVRADAGFVGFLSLGGMWSRTTLSNSLFNRDFTQMKGVATIFFTRNISLAASYGVFNSIVETNKKIGDVTLKFQNSSEYFALFSYEKNDARMVFYSPGILDISLDADLYRLNGFYNYNNIARISMAYNYYHLSDSNKGNDFQIRLGRRLIENTFFGYEYFFSDFAFISASYYSPQQFNSHSIWAEYEWSLKKNLKGKLGGKIGYVPASDYIISEFFGEATYNVISNLLITCRLAYTNSFRYDSSYKSFSANLFAYFGIF